MWLTLVAVGVGLIAGIVSGGSVATIGRSRPVWGSLALVWLMLTAVTRWVEVPGAIGLFIGANVAALMFCAVNIKRLGTALLFCGVALNTAVIAINGAMPYRISAVISAGLATSQSDFPQTVQTRPERASDRLAALSDIVPVNAGLIHDVLSVGDIIAALGIAWVVYRSLQRSRTSLVATPAAPLDGATAPAAALATPEPASAKSPSDTAAAQRVNRLHVSRIRIGEEFDLLDDDLDNLDDPNTRDTRDTLDVPQDHEPVTRSSISVIVDLTVDRIQNPHRHDADDILGSSALMSHVLGIGEEDILDISEGEIPGSLFWAERTRLLARAAHSAADTPRIGPTANQLPSTDPGATE